MTDTTDRVLPHSLAAEQSVLGACIMNAAAIDAAADILSPLDFYRDAHQKIFDAILALSNAGTEVDYLTLRTEMDRRGQMNDVGGMAYIASLTDGVPTSINAEHYAKIVKEKWRLREAIDAANHILTDAYAEDESSEVLERAEQTLFELRMGEARAGLVPASALTTRVFAIIEQLTETKKPVTGVPTGFVDIDFMTCGFQPGEFIVVGARPSMGKSAWALQVAMHAAEKTTLPVAFFSIEMSTDSLTLRSVAALGPIDTHRMRSGLLSTTDYTRLTDAIERFGVCPLWIDDSAGLSPMQLRSKARRLKAQHGLSMVIVDYLQMMTPTADAKRRRADNRTEELSRISHALKAIAKELKVPVVVLSQLSRAVESRADKRPLLSDLRESGAIEQDADVVAFLYRDHYYDRSKSPNDAEFIIAKQRNGPTGTVELMWFPDHTRFANAGMS